MRFASVVVCIWLSVCAVRKKDGIDDQLDRVSAFCRWTIVLAGLVCASIPETIKHSNKKYTFQTVQIDNGTPATLVSSFSAAGTNDHPNLAAQFQIDLKSSAGETDGYHEWFDDVKLCTLDPHTNCPSQ